MRNEILKINFVYFFFLQKFKKVDKLASFSKYKKITSSTVLKSYGHSSKKIDPIRTIFTVTQKRPQEIVTSYSRKIKPIEKEKKRKFCRNISFCRAHRCRWQTAIRGIISIGKLHSPFYQHTGTSVAGSVFAVTRTHADLHTLGSL